MSKLAIGRGGKDSKRTRRGGQESTKNRYCTLSACKRRSDHRVEMMQSIPAASLKSMVTVKLSDERGFSREAELPEQYDGPRSAAQPASARCITCHLSMSAAEPG